MESNALVALGYHYPHPNAAGDLARALVGDRSPEVTRHMSQFVEAVSALSLGEWEELHTSTLDLSPPFVPYVGHVVWGENYRRGEFMADLNSAMAAAEVELHGELPDHIEPVLRYMAATSEPLADLVEVLPGAVTEMEKTLRRAQPDNPYCHLLAATVACAANRQVSIGGRR